MAQVISGEILQLCPSDVRFVGRKLQFRRSLRNDIDDHQLRTIVEPRYARGFPRQTAADDHACIAARIHAARIFGKNALIRRVYAVDQMGNAPLPAVRVPRQHQIKRVFCVIIDPFGSVRNQQREIPVGGYARDMFKRFVE